MLVEYWFCNKNPFLAKDHQKGAFTQRPRWIQITFDDHRLVVNAGLLLPVTLARHLGLRELIDHHPELGGAPGRATTGDRMMIRSCVRLGGRRHSDVLRTGGTACTLGSAVKMPSTLGTLQHGFWCGHFRQLDLLSRELLIRDWQAGDGALSTYLDSAIREPFEPPRRGRTITACHILDTGAIAASGVITVTSTQVPGTSW